jgi:biopolymer transport protein ExbB
VSVIHETAMMMLSQAPAAPEAPAEVPLGIDSALDFLMKGGWAMVPIGLCSLLALTIIVERMVVLRKSRVMPRAAVDQLGLLANDPIKALEYCKQNRTPIASILQVAIKEAGESRETREKHVEEAGGREVVALRQRMRLLSSLPQVATMLGLLGTVFGMIKTFQAVAATSEALGKTEMLAKGIFEAWTCTAAGLLVAIPVLVMYHHLMGRIDALVAAIDATVAEWLEQHPSTAVEKRSSASLPRAVIDVAGDGHPDGIPAAVAAS